MNRKYWLAALANAFVVTIILMSATPRLALAQKEDCGTNCSQCAEGKKEGYSHNVEGSYNMGCLPATLGCVECTHPNNMVSDAATDPTALLNTLRSLPLHSLAQLAPTLKRRLLVDPGRGIVAVRGAACNPGAVAALAFLSRERIQILAQSGLPKLAAFFDQAAAKQAQ